MLVRSYRLLGSAKYRIIAELEKALPARPFAEEWNMVLSGVGRKRYWRLTWLEQWIPPAFAASYAISYVYYLLGRK
jgi:hypothetical protein